MGFLKTVYYAMLVLVVIVARTTWIVLVTTVLVVAWVIYNIVTFNVRLLFTRIPWKLKKTLIKSYDRVVFEKALELSFLSMAKHAISLLSISRSKSGPPRRGRLRGGCDK